MKLRVCEYCGTQYDKTKTRCPLCGLTPEEASAKDKDENDAVKTVKKQKKDPMPKWTWILSSIILGLAVLVGAAAFVIRMGYFEPDFSLEAIPTLKEETEEDVQEPDMEMPAEVEDKSCTALALSQSEIILKEAGDQAFLTAEPSPYDCDEPITFETPESESCPVTVTADGVITAVLPGEANVLVRCGNVVESCRVICDFETVEPKLNKEDFTLNTSGETFILTVSDVPDGETPVFESADPAVVTVDNDGLVTAIGNGQTEITVTVGSTKLTCIARCDLGSADSSSSYAAPFTISHSDVTLFSKGESFSLTLTDANGSTVSDVSWASSDNNICTVNGSSVKAAGSGQATVSTVYGGQSYECIVRCNF